MSTTDTAPGVIVMPEDADWDDARLAWNLAVDQRPAAIARPRNTAEVAEAVTRARAEGLRVAPQATGHAAAAMGPLDGTCSSSSTRCAGSTSTPSDVSPASRAGRSGET